MRLQKSGAYPASAVGEGRLGRVGRLSAMAAILLVVAGCSKSDDLFPAAPSDSEAPRASSAPNAVGNVNLPDFTQLVERQGPAVVNISASKAVPRISGAVPQLSEDPMLEFFRQFFPPEEVPQLQSLGSGFVIRADGYILTNAHVVAAADRIVVKMTDGRNFDATLIGLDPLTDIALLKIDAAGLPKVALGNVERVQVGEWVAAIGSPFGFENSVTAGIVSAKGRLLPGDSYVPFIQTDVAVNPGNSGGPLFNLQGEVIGINSQIYSQTGGYMGVSFSIPIDVVVDVSEQLRKTGKVVRGRLGVAIQDLSKQTAEAVGFMGKVGALVVGIEKRGPADKGGLEVGDVVLKYNKQTVHDSTEMRRLVASTKPGESVEVEIWRKGRSRVMRVVADAL
jgi:serine protease Do